MGAGGLSCTVTGELSSSFVAESCTSLEIARLTLFNWGYLQMLMISPRKGLRGTTCNNSVPTIHSAYHASTSSQLSALGFG